MTLTLPALREQPEAIPYLARSFLSDFCARAKRPVPDLSPQTLCALEAYRWPGNVRELRNTMVRAAAFCRGSKIEVSDLPEAVCRSSRASILVPEPDGGKGKNKLHTARKDGERAGLKDALRRHDDNRTKAAADLGVSRVTLYKKLRQYKLI